MKQFKDIYFQIELVFQNSKKLWLENKLSYNLSVAAAHHLKSIFCKILVQYFIFNKQYLLIQGL